MTTTPNDPRHDRPLSETDIQAYADGFLAPERAAHLRSYLGKRPGEARRVAFYSKLNQQIQHAFQPPAEALADEAATAGDAPAAPGRWLARRVQAVGRRPLRAMLALGTALALALVAASGWMAASQVSPQALDNAAVMALVQAGGGQFGAATGPVEGHSAAASDAVASGTMSPASASASPAPDDSPDPDTTTDPAAPNLAPVGMHLISHRTLKLGPLARVTEYIYLNTHAQPIVLLVAAAPPSTVQPQWSARRVGTLRLLIWTAHNQRYVLAGAANARGLMSAADLMTMH